MRKPTPHETLYAWHRAAMAGRKPQITTEPHCGWYRRRFVRGGPWVPARIWMHQEIDADSGELTAPERLRCDVGGKERDPIEQWTYLADRPIGESEYRYMISLGAWASAYADEHPAAKTDERVDFNTSPLPF